MMKRYLPPRIKKEIGAGIASSGKENEVFAAARLRVFRQRRFLVAWWCRHVAGGRERLGGAEDGKRWDMRIRRKRHCECFGYVSAFEAIVSGNSIVRIPREICELLCRVWKITIDKFTFIGRSYVCMPDRKSVV